MEELFKIDRPEEEINLLSPLVWNICGRIRQDL